MHKAKTKPKELTFSVLLGWRCLINSVLWREKKPSVSCINMSNNVLLIISKSSAFAHILHIHNIIHLHFSQCLNEIFSDFFLSVTKFTLIFLYFPSSGISFVWRTVIPRFSFNSSRCFSHFPLVHFSVLLSVSSLYLLPSPSLSLSVFRSVRFTLLRFFYFLQLFSRISLHLLPTCVSPNICPFSRSWSHVAALVAFSCLTSFHLLFNFRSVMVWEFTYSEKLHGRTHIHLAHS